MAALAVSRDPAGGLSPMDGVQRGASPYVVFHQPGQALTSLGMDYADANKFGDGDTGIST